MSSNKMGKKVRAACTAALDALKANHCVAKYSIKGEKIDIKWNDGGIDRVVHEVTTNPKPFGLSRNLRGGLLLILPQKDRDKAGAIFLESFKKNHGPVNQ